MAEQNQLGLSGGVGGGSRFEMKTKGGYELRLVRSAIQKTIRRGQEIESLYWAAEFHEGGYTGYLIRTLACILSEDVGWADPAAMAAVFSNLTFLNMMVKEKKDAYEFRPGLAAAVIMLCRARKTRAADNAWVYLEEKRKSGYRLEIPDVAYDEHTQEGRKLNRWWRFWVRNASKLVPRATQEEIGGTDYEKVMSEHWMGGHPSHQDESDWTEFDPNMPDAPIVAVPWTGEIATEENTEETAIPS